MIFVHELTRHFRSAGAPIIAVDGLSFHVRAGEVYGLLGPNGAGKTTTLRMILGLLAPTSGDAEVQGFKATSQPDEVKRRIGLVSASSGLYQWLTPREMLMFFADLYGVVPAAARDRLDEMAALFDLGPFLNQRCATLSTGQKQRVTLARALMHDPPVMLLDEPTRGLDVIGTHVVFEYITKLRSLGKSGRGVDASVGRSLARLRPNGAVATAGNCGTKARSPNCSRKPVATTCLTCSCCCSGKPGLAGSRLTRRVPMPDSGSMTPSDRRGAGWHSPRWWRMSVKELREILRDRRTIITLVAMPLLIYPLLGVTLQKLFLSQLASRTKIEYRIALESRGDDSAFRQLLGRGHTLVANRERRELDPLQHSQGTPDDPYLENTGPQRPFRNVRRGESRRQR